MILEMRDICKDYPMGKSVAHILKNVNLDVEEGEYLAIMGPSGSGKTTLMNLIGCLDVPTSGSYLLGGRDVTTCNNKQLAEVRNKELGFVFQSFNLLPKLTAVENVALPLLYGGVKKAERLERPAGAGDSGAFRPGGPPTGPAVRRTVPAGGHRTGHRGQAEAAAGRRANRRAGQRQRRGGDGAVSAAA